MESYAFLVAQRDYRSRFEVYSPPEIVDDGKTQVSSIKVRMIDKRSYELSKVHYEPFSISRSSNNIPSFWADAIKLENARQVILYKKNLEIDFVGALTNLLVEEYLNRDVKTASIKNSVVVYRAYLDEYRVEVPSNLNDKIQDYENLIAARALLLGYTIKEIKGSHFEVTSASGKVQATCLNKCTCKEFADFNDCLHNKFARAVARNRPHLGYLLG